MMRVFQLFADLLEYPTPELACQAQACAKATAAIHPDAVAQVDLFCARAKSTSLAHLQEVYTYTFDLKPNCYPYIGYHLFGESYKRGAFMARLNEEYCARGFASGTELPDHLAIVLRFLALDGDTEFSQTLLHEGLVPALDRMAKAFGNGGDNPYSKVIQALLLVLQENVVKGVDNA